MAAQPRMHRTRHGLDENARRSIVVLLNQRLADAFDLHSQTKHAHWNTKGINFYQLHLLYDALAETVEAHVDQLAERATALGGSALGTIRMAAQSSSLPDFPREAADERAFLHALIERYAEHARKVGEGIGRAEENGDRGTADLLSQQARELDKALYFLESHVQGSAATTS
jgi:starvation-inducible DNA-binding protein